MDKKSHTLRERLPVGHFVTSALILVEKWSERRDPSSVNRACFPEEPCRTQQIWTLAYQWTSVDRVVLEERHNCYYVDSSKYTKKLTKKWLQQYVGNEG